MYKLSFFCIILIISCTPSDEVVPSGTNQIILSVTKNYAPDSLSGIRVKGRSTLRESQITVGVIDTFINSDSTILVLDTHLKGVHEIKYSIAVTYEDSVTPERALGDWFMTTQGSQTGEFRFGILDVSESTELAIERCFEANEGRLTPIICQ